MKLIAGLGNPGRSYARQRHNAGFLVVDELAKRHGIRLAKRSFGALTGSGVLAGESVLLVKPMQYMNLSGGPVRSLLGYYRLGPDSLIVVHDDLDIEPGRIKLGRGSGHAGHNGVRSIIDELDTCDFLRVRVGVGRPPEDVDGADYVLSPFDKSEKEAVAETVAMAADAVALLVEKGLAAAQQKYH
ncbi:MAG: aminoacyl-tRNA hydrolase [Proteobacteria bacterium]|nr:aminoacyl-tRNA hydrolase [Pseudomonadota bacterium]